MTTVSAAIFLVSPGTNIATTSILGLSEHGYWDKRQRWQQFLSNNNPDNIIV